MEFRTWWLPAAEAAAFPSCAASVVMIDSGRVRSFDCGIDAEEAERLLSKKTRMMVIRSSIAVMLRKLISGSRALARIAFRSAALYLTTLPCLYGGGRPLPPVRASVPRRRS